ncbi:DUF1826 domain-containing protein [Paracoccus ravus]|uniref:DUF1826 domain-containing protein n=1 Tax=Paracoccus ravus TaxID=2447760 RepID=UPI00106E95E7|nr:DUF1826 domain-containing protein [Paracoccus ravus]
MAGFRFATSVNSGTDPRVLATIAIEGVSLALWNRSLPEELDIWLASLPVESLPRFDGRVASQQVAKTLRARNPAAAFGPGAAFAEEVAGLAKIASEIFASPLLDLRLGPACGMRQSGWQLDAATARLRCSFLGSAFEYGLLRAKAEETKPHHLSRGTVGIIRGALWPGDELAAIVHRPSLEPEQGSSLHLMIGPVEPVGSC